eukprot:930689-Prymnesium_polylepis.1
MIARLVVVPCGAPLGGPRVALGWDACCQGHRMRRVAVCVAPGGRVCCPGWPCVLRRVAVCVAPGGRVCCPGWPCLLPGARATHGHVLFPSFPRPASQPTARCTAQPARRRAAHCYLSRHVPFVCTPRRASFPVGVRQSFDTEPEIVGWEGMPLGKHVLNDYYLCTWP